MSKPPSPKSGAAKNFSLDSNPTLAEMLGLVDGEDGINFTASGSGRNLISNPPAPLPPRPVVLGQPTSSTGPISAAQNMMISKEQSGESYLGVDAGPMLISGPTSEVSTPQQGSIIPVAVQAPQSRSTSGLSGFPNAQQATSVSSGANSEQMSSPLGSFDPSQVRSCLMVVLQQLERLSDDVVRSGPPDLQWRYPKGSGRILSIEDFCSIVDSEMRQFKDQQQQREVSATSAAMAGAASEGAILHPKPPSGNQSTHRQQQDNSNNNNTLPRSESSDSSTSLIPSSAGGGDQQPRDPAKARIEALYGLLARLHQASCPSPARTPPGHHQQQQQLRKTGPQVNSHPNIARDRTDSNDGTAFPLSEASTKTMPPPTAQEMAVLDIISVPGESGPGTPVGGRAPQAWPSQANFTPKMLRISSVRSKPPPTRILPTHSERASTRDDTESDRGDIYILSVHGSLASIRRGSVHENIAEHGVDEAGFETINNYSIIRELGRGNYGKVVLACDEEGNQFAIKTMDCGVKAPKHRFGGNHCAGALGAQGRRGSTVLPDSMVMREVAIMKKLRHSNIVQLKEVIHDEDDDQTHLVMQYINNGPITRMESNGTCKKIEDTNLAKSYIRQAATGLEYLHRQRIVHRDVKPENVLVGSDSDAYLADFGVSAVLSADKVVDISAGTQMFFSPELVRGNFDEASKYGKQSDIWALGVTFYAIIFGKVPFWAPNVMALANSILNDPVPFPDDFPSDDPLREIFQGLLQKDPEKRWSLRKLRYHKSILSASGIEPAKVVSETSAKPTPPATEPTETQKPKRKAPTVGFSEEVISSEPPPLSMLALNEDGGADESPGSPAFEDGGLEKSVSALPAVEVTDEEVSNAIVSRRVSIVRPLVGAAGLSRPTKHALPPLGTQTHFIPSRIGDNNSEELDDETALALGLHLPLLNSAPSQAPPPSGASSSKSNHMPLPAVRTVKGPREDSNITSAASSNTSDNVDGPPRWTPPPAMDTVPAQKQQQQEKPLESSPGQTLDTTSAGSPLRLLRSRQQQQQQS